MCPRGENKNLGMAQCWHNDADEILKMNLKQEGTYADEKIDADHKPRATGRDRKIYLTALKCNYKGLKY